MPPTPPADFLTGGGFIIVNGAHANFGVGGGCKEGGDGHGWWGHLEYIDHGMGLNVHWTMITAYMNDLFGDSQARFICGTATTNDPMHRDVSFAVRAADHHESGGVDQFDIQVIDTSGFSYTTFIIITTGSSPNTTTTFFPHSLEGGNIILHPPNPSITGTFTEQCPAAPSVGGGNE